MKNDIDALLEAMFRNGKLNLKGTSEKKPAPPEQSKPVSLEWDPLENSRQARQALDAVEQGSAGISEALQKNLEQLARDAEAEMKGLAWQMLPPETPAARRIWKRPSRRPAGRRGSACWVRRSSFPPF